MTRWHLGLFCGVLLLPAAAQAQSVALPGRFDVAAGVLWIGSASAGAAQATETAADGSRFGLFSSESSLTRAFGFEGRIGVRLSPGLQLEGSASRASPGLRTRITADAEGVPAVTLAETLDQWTVEGALVAHVTRWRIGTRGVPFLSAGAGYLRQLHEGRTLVETGQIYQVGGGVNVLLNRGRARWLEGIGLRLGARAAVRAGGATFDRRMRVSPRVDASLFARF